MGTGRLEAFSDGVIAIIITIMVLELKAPHGAGRAGIALSLWRSWLAVTIYVLVAIMWIIPDRRIEK